MIILHQHRDLPEKHLIKYIKGEKTMEENVKLEKIKHSCEVGEKVTKFFFVFFIILSICCIVFISIIGAKGNEFESFIQKHVDLGHISFENSIGSSKAINITIMNPNNIHSDVEAVRDALATKPYSVVFMIYGIAGLVIFIVMAVMMKLVGGALRIIKEEENPFTDKAIRRIVTVMIVISIMLFFGPGTVFGILGLVVTWVVHTVMDYGKTLQIQSDETL